MKVTNDVIRGDTLTAHAEELENDNLVADDVPIIELRRPTIENESSNSNAVSPDNPSNAMSRRLSRRQSMRSIGSGKRLSAVGEEEAQSVGKSDTSGMSSQRREAMSAQRLREAKIEKRMLYVKVLFIAKVILLVCLAVSNYSVASNLLWKSRSSLDTIDWYDLKCFYLHFRV
jgi:hypothetical protein